VLIEHPRHAGTNGWSLEGDVKAAESTPSLYRFRLLVPAHSTTKLEVREHGPEVLFSVFTPGTHLLPHRGVTNTRLVGHLPLMVPEDCALKVGGELHQWQEGQVVIFDDTYEHEAWNRSDKTRVVMIFDIWNPHLSEAERAAVTDLIPAMGDFREAVESTP